MVEKIECARVDKEFGTSLAAVFVNIVFIESFKCTEMWSKNVVGLYVWHRVNS